MQSLLRCTLVLYFVLSVLALEPYPASSGFFRLLLFRVLTWPLMFLTSIGANFTLDTTQWHLFLVEYNLAMFPFLHAFLYSLMDFQPFPVNPGGCCGSGSVSTPLWESTPLRGVGSSLWGLMPEGYVRMGVISKDAMSKDAVTQM